MSERLVVLAQSAQRLRQAEMGPRIVGVNLKCHAKALNSFLVLLVILEKTAQVGMASGIVWIVRQGRLIVTSCFLAPLLRLERISQRGVRHCRIRPAGQRRAIIAGGFDWRDCE